MSKVLFLYETNMPTVDIMKAIYCNLNIKYGICSEFKQITFVKQKDINRNAVLVFLRPNDVLSYEVAKIAKSSGRFVVVMCDDDLLRLPLELPSIPWRGKYLIKILGLSDAIWSPSHYICEKYSTYMKSNRWAVTDTIITSDEVVAMNSVSDDIKCKKKIVKIIYAANAGHVELFNKYILPIVPKLVEKYKNQISFTFISVRPDLSEFERDVYIEYKPTMPFKEYRQFMCENQFDIGLAPLNIDEFSKCKYYNKYIEYTMVGIAGIYTRTEPYTFKIKNRENGFLADNTETGWFNACCEAIENPALRRKCVNNAQQDLKENFTEDEIVKKLLKDIPEFSRYENSLKDCRNLARNKAKYYLMRIFDWMYLSIFYLKRGGIGGLVKKIKKHIEESKKYGK